MELRQLKHFLTVGEAGSITAAAKALRLTQPALSRQIKALEEELETALLERGALTADRAFSGYVQPRRARGKLLLQPYVGWGTPGRVELRGRVLLPRSFPALEVAPRWS